MRGFHFDEVRQFADACTKNNWFSFIRFSVSPTQFQTHFSAPPCTPRTYATTPFICLLFRSVNRKSQSVA